MRLRIRLLAFALLATLAPFARAAGVDGQWTADVPGRGGETQASTFTFNSDGGKLTGTVANQMGERPIEEGKIEGDDLSFVQNLEFNGNKVRILYKGKVSGNEIKFTRQRDGGQGRVAEFVAKRK